MARTRCVRPFPARLWAAEELALLGALPDAEVARRTGRTRNAVALKRHDLGRPAVRGRRRSPTRKGAKP
jgi:hypothetical protein